MDYNTQNEEFSTDSAMEIQLPDFMPESDKRRLLHILNRHETVVEDDIFGRNILLPKKNRYPDVPVLSANDIGSVAKFYNSLSNKLMDKYSTICIKRGEMLNPSAILDIPTIFIYQMLPPSNNENTATRRNIQLSQRQKNVLRRYGWKVFVPYYDKMLMCVNSNRWLYVEKSNVTDDSMDIRVSIYIGDLNLWMMHSALTIKMKMGTPTETEAPCSFEYSDPMLYEKFLCQNINRMGWSQKEKNLWVDTFSIPCDWNKTTLCTVQRDGADDIEIFAYNGDERNLLTKLFKARPIADKKELERRISKTLSKRIVPEYMDMMAFLFTYLYERGVKKPESVVLAPIQNLDKEITCYRYDNLIVTTDEPIDLPWLKNLD